jgi:hypothetical protein
MEDRLEKREREDNYVEEPITKKLCNTHEGVLFKIPVHGKRCSEFGTYALCSAEDYDNVSKHSWHWHTDGYPATRLLGSKKRTFMSRLVMEAKKGTLVDHINRDRKDNRRENLRIVTYSQNAQNRTKKAGSSSSYKGVYYSKRQKKFGANLKINSYRHHLGYFDDEIDAAKTYDKYVVQNREKLDICHPLNFPEDIDIYKDAPLVMLKKNREPKSNFFYVKKENKKFVAIVQNGEKRIRLGLYSTAEEAAKVADNYIVQNNLDRKLNFPENYPNFDPKKVKLHVTEIDLSDSIIRDIIKDIGEHTELADVDPDRDVLIQIGGKNKDKYTIIERSDYERIKYFSIRAPGGYALLSKGPINHMLSRFLFNDMVGKDEFVDHICSNTLDNRRRFLKVVSIGQNNQNRRKSIGKSSKFSGVSKWKDRYIIHISNNGKSYRKYMKDEFEAGRLRDLFIIHNYPNDNYYMNFKDWDEETKKYWTNYLKQHINWDVPFI